MHAFRCETQNTVEITAYKDLLARVDEIDAWLCSRGLNQQMDRIRRNRADVAQLSEAFDEGRLGKFIDEAGEDRRRELMWSLAESMEFVDSIDALRQQARNIPDRVLRTALDGPTDLLSETEKSNAGRNTMFEIAMAGRLATAGLHPTLGEEPDVHLEYKSRKIFIQCKRYFRWRRFRSAWQTRRGSSGVIWASPAVHGIAGLSRSRCRAFSIRVTGFWCPTMRIV